MQLRPLLTPYPTLSQSVSTEGDADHFGKRIEVYLKNTALEILSALKMRVITENEVILRANTNNSLIHY